MWEKHRIERKSWNDNGRRREKDIKPNDWCLLLNKKISPYPNPFSFTTASHVDGCGSFFAKIDTRCLHWDKSNSEGRQKLVHFCRTMHASLYAHIKTTQNRKTALFTTQSFSCVSSSNISFFLNISRLMAKTQLFLRQDRPTFIQLSSNFSLLQ